MKIRKQEGRWTPKHQTGDEQNSGGRCGVKCSIGNQDSWKPMTWASGYLKAEISPRKEAQGRGRGSAARRLGGQEPGGTSGRNRGDVEEADASQRNKSRDRHSAQAQPLGRPPPGFICRYPLSPHHPCPAAPGAAPGSSSGSAGCWLLPSVNRGGGSSPAQLTSRLTVTPGQRIQPHNGPAPNRKAEQHHSPVS